MVSTRHVSSGATRVWVKFMSGIFISKGSLPTQFIFIFVLNIGEYTKMLDRICTSNSGARIFMSVCWKPETRLICMRDAQVTPYASKLQKTSLTFHVHPDQLLELLIKVFGTRISLDSMYWGNRANIHVVSTLFASFYPISWEYER